MERVVVEVSPVTETGPPVTVVIVVEALLLAMAIVLFKGTRP